MCTSKKDNQEHDVKVDLQQGILRFREKNDNTPDQGLTRLGSDNMLKARYQLTHTTLGV